jgi:dihydrofolate reductase
MGPFVAIAAISANRVIGKNSQIPWHLPEDFKWFKRLTSGHTLLMGRKTFESIGKPLPNRTTLVLSRSGFQYPGVLTIKNLSEARPAAPDQKIFVCGGAEIYALALPFCSELYLTHVRREVDGDTFFPPFESLFTPGDICLQTPDFEVRKYLRK